jgi:hypothetical protein
MPDVVELGRFLVPTERGIVTLQSAGVEVDETHLIPGLARDVAKVGHYQVWLSSPAQDLVKIRIIVYRVAPNAALGDQPGEVVCDQRAVQFYDETVTILALAMGSQGEFILPDGIGEYRVIVMTDRNTRDVVSRRAIEIISDEADPNRVKARLEEHDGDEWYRIYFQYTGPIVDDDQEQDD